MTLNQLILKLMRLSMDGHGDEIVFDEGDPMFAACDVIWNPLSGTVMIEFDDAREVAKCRKDII